MPAKKIPKDQLTPELLRLFLVEYVSDRVPRSRIAGSYQVVLKWVDEYLAEHPGVLEDSIPKLNGMTWEMDELLALLPGFWTLMKAKDPTLHERPTGMY